MKKEKKEKSILSLIAKNTTSAVGGYALDKLSDATSGIRKRLDPRNIARQMAGPGLLGDVAEGLTSGAMKATGFGAKKLFGLVSKKKKDPRYTTVSNGPIRPLKLGDSVADILGKMYNFMLKTDQVYKLNGEIEQSFRQEQIDEDERRHKALVKAIKDFTKKYKKDDTKEKEEKGGFLDTILNGLKLWALELLADLTAFAAGVAALIAALAFGLKMAPPPLPKTSPKESPKESPKINPEIKPKTSPSKNTKTPAQRRSEPKTRSGSSKAERISRNTKAPTEAPKSTFKKITEGGKKALEAAGKMKKWVKDLGRGSAGKAFAALNVYLTYKEIEDAEQQFKDGKIDEHEMHKRIVKSVASTVGAYATMLAATRGKIGFWKGLAVSAVGAEASAYIAGEIFDKLTISPGVDINEEINKLVFATTGGGAAMGGAHIKKVPIPVPTSNKTIPMSYENRLGLASGENVVAVNNSVKNIGGKPSRVLSTNSAKQRNSDLDRFLSNSSVVV